MQVAMNTKWIEDLFYFMYKDYGITINYTQVGKGEINIDTGTRTNNNKTIEIQSVKMPKNLQTSYLKEMLGRVDTNKTYFLVHKSQLPQVDTEDYINYNGERYQQLEFEDLVVLYVISGTAIKGALPYNTQQLTTTDTLGINDGSA